VACPRRPGCWGRGRWIGALPFYLGVGTNQDGSLRSGWGIERPLWSPKRLRVESALEVHPHHLKLPFLWLWVPLAVPPAAILIVRRLRRREPHECPRCGYDLRGAVGPCPECGTAVAAPTLNGYVQVE